MLELLGLAGDDFAEAIFARCGVAPRHLDLTPELVAQTLQARSPLAERRTQELAEQALAQLDFDPAEIGVVVSASLPARSGRRRWRTGWSRASGCRAACDKYHVVGVGCASAVPLLRLASQALRERPGQRALVVAAEWMSGILTPVLPTDAKVKTIGSSLFGDGAGRGAAGARRAPRRAGRRRDRRPRPPRIVASAVHQLPGTLADVRSEMTSLDSQVQMSKALPVYARTRLAGLIDAFLARHGLDRSAIDHWPVHPGGRGILDGIKAGVGLTDDDVRASAAVLAEHGNVGTPSAFFVLDELVGRRRPRPGERGLMATIGPGVTGRPRAAPMVNPRRRTMRVIRSRLRPDEDDVAEGRAGAAWLRPCLRMIDVLREPSLAAPWKAAAAGGQVDWVAALDGWGSTVDWPACAFWEQHMEAFPEAKVLLSVRDKEAWYRSCLTTIFEAKEMAGRGELAGNTEERRPASCWR